MSNSALPSHQKRTILTQECLRRLRNTQIELGRGVQIKHLNNFMVVMKNSGYSANYRKQILDSSEKAFEKMVKDDQLGVKPLYRDKKWNKELRKTQKHEKKLNWYKNGGKGTVNKIEMEYTTVLFVPITKGGILAKEVKKRLEELNRNSKERFKVVESGGIELKSLLIKKDPFPKSKCDQKKCFICNSEKSDHVKFECTSNSVGYRLLCDTCMERGLVRVYEGESSRSARVRGSEHLRDFTKNNPSSVMFKHKQNEHSDEEMKISMKIVQKFRDPLTREANEAVRINNRNKKKYELLNSKNEFHHPPIARIVVEKRDKRKF